MEKLSALAEFDEAHVEQAFDATLQEHKLTMGQLAQPVRVALTGATVSPGIHDVIVVLGKERTLKRLQRALDYIHQPTLFAP